MAKRQFLRLPNKVPMRGGPGRLDLGYRNITQTPIESDTAPVIQAYNFNPDYPDWIQVQFDEEVAVDDDYLNGFVVTSTVDSEDIPLVQAGRGDVLTRTYTWTNLVASPEDMTQADWLTLGGSSIVDADTGQFVVSPNNRIYYRLDLGDGDAVDAGFFTYSLKAKTLSNHTDKTYWDIWTNSGSVGAHAFTSDMTGAYQRFQSDPYKGKSGGGYVNHGLQNKFPAASGYDATANVDMTEHQVVAGTWPGVYTSTSTNEDEGAVSTSYVNIQLSRDIRSDEWDTIEVDYVT